MVTFSRGDIVRLRSDEQEAERCEGESSREYHRSRRYIVLGVFVGGFTFRLPNGIEVRGNTVAELWPATPDTPWLAPVRFRIEDLVATGERAEEIA